MQSSEEECVSSLIKEELHLYMSSMQLYTPDYI